MSGGDTAVRPDLLRLRGALYDPITGLPSLPVLFDTMRELLEKRRAIGILHVSIPSLALTESVYGWQLIDRVRARLAAEVTRQRGVVLPADTLLSQTTVHGPELIAIVPDGPAGAPLASQGLASLARDLEALLAPAFSGGEWHGIEPAPTPRVGYAALSENPFYRLERLIYRAVDEARARPARADARIRRSWGEEIQRIIQDEGVRIHYQPVVDLRTLEVYGYEALSRGPEGSSLESPGVLFELSREAGVAHELDRLCRRLALGSARGMPAGRKIFINTRLDSAGDPEWSDPRIEEWLARIALVPGDLVVDLPQPGALADDVALGHFARELKRRGFLLAIDDIGTGYAGIQAIERLEPDFLKIDISLVRGIDRNLLQQDLLASLVSIGRRIGAAVIAEGIEQEAELACLRGHGANYGQGFLFSAAVPHLVPGPMILAGGAR